MSLGLVQTSVWNMFRKDPARTRHGTTDVEVHSVDNRDEVKAMYDTQTKTKYPTFLVGPMAQEEMIAAEGLYAEFPAPGYCTIPDPEIKVLQLVHISTIMKMERDDNRARGPIILSGVRI